MKAPVFVIGLGQLGVAFSEGFLKLGHPVVPILRGENTKNALALHGAPELVLVAVGEDDLAGVLDELPSGLHESVVLLQNELRPTSWQEQLGAVDPSLVIVWFEKKPDRVALPVLPSIIFGRKQELLLKAFEKMQLPARLIGSVEALSHELVVKNLYILGLNLTGLMTQGKAGELLSTHQDLFAKICAELIALEQGALSLVQNQLFSQIVLDHEKLLADLKTAILADPHHGCAGRSAPRRLERTLALAADLQILVPTISSLQAQLKQ